MTSYIQVFIPATWSSRIVIPVGFGILLLLIFLFCINYSRVLFLRNRIIIYLLKCIIQMLSY